MKSLITIAFAAALLACGCTTRIGDFTVASTKNMDIKKSLHRTEDKVRNVGVDKKHFIVFIPTGIPDMKEAMDDAIEKSPGAVGLSNVTMKYRYWVIPLIYGQFWYEAEGNPVFEVEKN